MHSLKIVLRYISNDRFLVKRRYVAQGEALRLRPGDFMSRAGVFGVHGSPAYMSSEVLSLRIYVFATDIWSFGIVVLHGVLQ